MKRQAMERRLAEKLLSDFLKKKREPKPAPRAKKGNRG